MKIARIACTIINVPLDKPYFWSYGELSGFTKTIVEVETADGITGPGGAPGAGSVSLITSEFAPNLIGRDPIDVQGCESVSSPFPSAPASASPSTATGSNSWRSTSKKRDLTTNSTIAMHLGSFADCLTIPVIRQSRVSKA